MPGCRFANNFVLAAAIATGLFSPVADHAVNADELPSIAEIRDGYLANLSRITSMSLEWTEVMEFSDDSPANIKSHMPSVELPARVSWLQKGNKVRLERLLGTTPQKTTISNGRVIWEFEFVPGQTEPFLVRESSFNESYMRQIGAGIGLERYLGRALSKNPEYSLHNISIDEFLGLAQCRAARIQNVDGSRCAVVECDEWQQGKDPAASEMTFWFDLENGLLPRKVQVRSAGSAESAFELVLESIEKFNTESGAVYFPLRIQAVQIGNGRTATKNIAISQVKFSSDLPDSAFELPAQYRSKILNPKKMARNEVARTLVELHETRVKASVGTASSQGSGVTLGNMPDATPPKGALFQRWSAVFGIASLALAAVVLFRPRR